MQYYVSSLKKAAMISDLCYISIKKSGTLVSRSILLEERGVMGLVNVRKHTLSRRQFVLVVDSDAGNLLYTSTLLKRFQYKVCTARTSGEAVEIATIFTPVLIITAQHLIDMPGLDLIRQIKLNVAARTASIIVLASKTDPVNERACLAAGAVTCLSTPVSVEDLYRVVQMTIEPVPRMNIRINTSLRVTINDRSIGDCGDGGCLQALSEYGAFIRTNKPYPLNTRLQVQIHLAESTLPVKAQVIYNCEAENKRNCYLGMGLHFVQLSPQDQQRIRMFIRGEITKDIDRSY